LKKELLALAKASPITEDIETILFIGPFPWTSATTQKFSGSSWRFGRKRNLTLNTLISIDKYETHHYERDNQTNDH
jgi:hypothetical protein